MPRLNVKELMEREAKAQARKDEWRSIYEDCYEFALPQRNLYSGNYEGKVAGKAKMSRVFDSTAIHATQRFANRLQAGLFPPYKSWCRLEPGSQINEQDKVQVQEIFDKYSDQLFETLRQTNFDLAMGEFLLDMAVGTGVMMITAGDESTPVRFTPIAQYLVAIEEGANGVVENVYRKLRVKAECVQREFPGAQMTVELAEAIERRPDQELDLFDAVVYDQDTGRYHYHVVWPSKKQELVYREMRSSPFVVSRYMKVAGEVYGRGPLTTAIADIKTLNKTLELVLKNASLSIAGVYTAAAVDAEARRDACSAAAAQTCARAEDRSSQLAEQHEKHLETVEAHKLEIAALRVSTKSARDANDATGIEEIIGGRHDHLQ